MYCGEERKLIRSTVHAVNASRYWETVLSCDDGFGTDHTSQAFFTDFKFIFLIAQG